MPEGILRGQFSPRVLLTPSLQQLHMLGRFMVGETKKITRAQYHELAGLMLLARRYNRALKDIERAALWITMEIDPATDELSEVYGGGHTGDQVYSTDADADELIRLLKIEVEDNG